MKRRAFLSGPHQVPQHPAHLLMGVGGNNEAGGGRNDLWVMHLHPESDRGDVDSWIEESLDMDENRPIPLGAPKVGRVRESDEDRASRGREATHFHGGSQQGASSRVLPYTPKGIRRWAQRNGITYNGNYARGILFIDGRGNPEDLLSGDVPDMEVEPADFEGYEDVVPNRHNSL